MTEVPPNVIETASGRYYDFLDPDPAVISVRDIAHALGNICRFAGHTQRFYSVAEHSVIVHDLVAAGDHPGLRLHALFHDAHEAYVWDAPRPIKPLLGEQFAGLADTADWAVGEALGLDHKLFKHPTVKVADDRALLEEARRLLPNGPDHWSWPTEEQKGQLWPHAVRAPIGLSPSSSKQLFLARCREEGIPV